MDCYEFSGEDNPLAEVKACASAFPFSGGVKAILYKDFEKVKDDKLLDEYLKANYDFTHLVIVHSGTIKSFEKGYLKELKNRDCVFEAAKPRGADLQEWIMQRVRQNNKTITKEGALLLLELCGDERFMIEMQLEKIFVFLGGRQSITPEVIMELSSVTKQYQLYELHAAVARKNGEKILQIGFNMLERGESLIGIISSLNKFFMNLFRMVELINNQKNDFEIQKELGITQNTLLNYKAARNNYRDAEIMRIASALLYADLKLKTANPEDLDIFTFLAGAIVGKVDRVFDEELFS